MEGHKGRDGCQGAAAPSTWATFLPALQLVDLLSESLQPLLNLKFSYAHVEGHPLCVLFYVILSQMKCFLRIPLQKIKVESN